MPTDAAEVINHWYWRPGWSVGSRFYTWHITFADKPEVLSFAQRYREQLSPQPMLDVIPDQWLHLTMQGVGFVNDVSTADANAIVSAARERCSGLNAFELSLDRPYVDPESIQVAVQPSGQVRQLRTELRRAIADVWGEARVPEAAEPYSPHMSLAYINSAGPSTPLVKAIDAVDNVTGAARIESCQLIVLNRDAGMYVWEPYATVSLGQ